MTTPGAETGAVGGMSGGIGTERGDAIGNRPGGAEGGAGGSPAGVSSSGSTQGSPTGSAASNGGSINGTDDPSLHKKASGEGGTGITGKGTGTLSQMDLAVAIANVASDPLAAAAEGNAPQSGTSGGLPEGTHRTPRETRPFKHSMSRRKP
ncbi:hypothetical protein OIE68_00900 [Nocardia vinacea]|uniref:hypothetical protein n=1 Tax=Nocardia vinacea TaxID=96468 RepID=UPI002E14DF72|nr:hypothetical protein OIE68_00900 [Nocardia vinacea]